MFKHTSFPRATWECRAGRAASRIRDVARDSRRSAPWRHSHAARGNENSGIPARTTASRRHLCITTSAPAWERR